MAVVAEFRSLVVQTGIASMSQGRPLLLCESSGLMSEPQAVVTPPGKPNIPVLGTNRTFTYPRGSPKTCTQVMLHCRILSRIATTLFS